MRSLIGELITFIGARRSWRRYRDYVRIHPTAIIAPGASIHIFNPPSPPRICLEIGAGSHIFGSFDLLRPESTIRIGERCQIGASHFICADSIEVGDDALMAWGITLMDNDAHSRHWEERRYDVKQCYADYVEDSSNFIRNKDWSVVPMAPITIGSRCWIGFNASVLKGVRIGDEAVIGACSVVTHAVPAGAVVAGNPARIVHGPGDIVSHG